MVSLASAGTGIQVNMPEWATKKKEGIIEVSASPNAFLADA
jgi:hypothetical protein